jgi:hypothetical protein
VKTYDVDTKVTITISTATVVKVAVAATATAFFTAVSAKLLASSLEKQLKKRDDTWAAATNGEEGEKDAVHEDHKGRKQR